MSNDHTKIWLDHLFDRVDDESLIWKAYGPKNKEGILFV